MPSIVSVNEYVVLWIGLAGCVIYGVIAGLIALFKNRRRRKRSDP